MFVKSKETQTLGENLEESIKVEKDLEAISNHPGNEENEASISKKNGKKNKGSSKMDLDKKQKEPTNMDSIQRIIKKLTNEIIDLKKSNGEGKKPFKPFIKKSTIIDTPPQIPPSSGINLEEYVMEYFCHTHHANHSKKTCPKFINLLSAMLLPSKPPKKDEKEEEKEEEEVEPSSNLNLIWDETKIDDVGDDVMEETFVGNDYNL